MALYTLIGHLWCHDVIGFLLLLEKTCLQVFYCSNFIAYIRFFLKAMIEMKINISIECSFF